MKDITDKQPPINDKTLIAALSKMLETEITRADYEAVSLEGGTLGEVWLITGLAKSAAGKKLPYKVVWKRQKKWERPGDSASWRREYDLYATDLGNIFNDTFRWPKCYYAAISSHEMQLWLEYIEGVSGERLTLEMLTLTAVALGRLQGRIYTTQKEALGEIGCLSTPETLYKSFEQWHTQTFSYAFLLSEECYLPTFLKQMLKNGDILLQEGKSFEYACLRAKTCHIPAHLKQMLIDLDDRREAVFASFKKLPIVLCHRDFWIENIFWTEGKVRLIDWDSTGWGYLGEDIASLIYDETETGQLTEYFQKLIPAYVKGLSEYMEVPPDLSSFIPQMILMVFGYRIVQSYMFTESSEVQEEQIQRLQKIYDMMHLTEDIFI